MRDVVVIGAGLSGLSAAVYLLQAGREVDLITKGIGGIQLGQGTIDLYGYNPNRVNNPLGEIDKLSASHPYGKLGSKAVANSANWLKEQLGADLLVGSPDKNVFLPTSLGAWRPTCLPQPSMLAGTPADGKKYLIVGLRQLKDFYPQIVAENLEKAEIPGGGKVSARYIWIDIPVRHGEADTSGLNFARALDIEDFRARFCDLVKPHLKEGEVVGFPAVLGLKDHRVWKDIARRLVHEVFEIPLLPPSIPGMRINETLTQTVRDLGARYIIGSEVTGLSARDQRVESITINSAGSDTTIKANHFIYAGGGFESGSLRVDSYWNVTERAFDLPLLIPDGPLVHEDYWGPNQPLFEVGVQVDSQMRVLADTGAPLYQNLYAAGGLLAGATRWREKSGDGIAIASALRACETILGESNE
ncbi:glycerol-3-phosphate dehydrogenase subunit GlpB [Varibaculum vaginae]|uniref:glycerol-3-phosphate dehydrogenase subunit GlpB n=1 Tax=Varibaculum vaginae TaxID=2364797 RepID=UPI000F0967E2|nr:glycerol-3-phosphate dehydrogenase subunit GlpB [Varibaculum vaginae]